MGIIERKARHNHAVKNGILQAARRIAIEDGWRKVSIRGIAKLIEYSPPVIYQHFKNKEAVLRQLQIDGFEILRKQIAVARETAFEPELQLTNISLAYWRFSLDYPELYQVMFNLEGVFVNTQSTTAELKRAGKPAMEILFGLTDSPEELEEVFFNWWAVVHGFISITMTQSLPIQGKEAREGYLRRAITRFVTSVKYTTGR
jgi:AcrR family transcriptional regulator